MEYLVLLVLLLLMLIYLVYESYSKRLRKPIYAIRELLVCNKCNYRIEKDFEPGDFIGLIKGKCPRCGGELKLRGIYAVEQQTLKTHKE